MALKDWKTKFASWFSRGAGDDSRRPDGGTSCYRPTRKKDPWEDAVPAAGPTAGDASAAVQQTPYIHTGFTGMNPPGGAPDPSDAYTAWSGSWQAAPRNAGYGPAARADASRSDRGGSPQQETGPRDNISYMPGVVPSMGNPFNHVVHILVLTSLKSCYEAIACMKNGETLLVTLDAIANDSESMRCQDMLAGAAFTLGCGVRMLQGGRLALIAPETVAILPEETLRAPEAPPVWIPPMAPSEPAPARRERRRSANAENWNAAANGGRPNYNPYTGDVPVAAGGYAAFGGYGG